MNTNISNRISDIDQEEKAITTILYKPGDKTEGRFIQRIRPIVKTFGFLSTLAWVVAALSPTTFRIPVPLQGWVFTIAIVWFFAYCAGLFNL